MQWFLIRNKGKVVASLEGIKHPTAEQWANAFPRHKPDFANFKSHTGDIFRPCKVVQILPSKLQLLLGKSTAFVKDARAIGGLTYLLVSQEMA